MRRQRVLALLAVLIVLPGAGPPDVARLRAPADKAGTFFPPGTAIRGLSAPEFETLVEQARAGVERRSGLGAPRLLQARHSARFQDGFLFGRSELTVDPTGAGPSNPKRDRELELNPWTPAIDPAGEAPSPLRASDSGQTAIRVEPSGPATIALSWRLRARTSANGRGFTLGLPRTDCARLTLDLPAGWVPEGPSGIRRGPEPGPAAGRSLWTFDGTGGLIDLQLRDPADLRDSRREARITVSGRTRIDLNETNANWRTEWDVTVAPRGPRRFQFELEPGLELSDAIGPGVEQYRTGHGGRQVTIVLNDDVTGTTPVVIRAQARVPAEGGWIVPSVRPLDALWTGGTTTVRLDAGRVLKECRERAGRRVASRPGDVLDASLLVFEASAPSPVADLVFRAPWTDVSAEVRGQLLLGNAAPRLACQVIWTAHRGRLLALDVDLPAAWVPDRIQVEGTDETISWHAETRPDGGARVHVIPPSVDFSRRSAVLSIAATATVAGGRGPIALPRVRPVGARLSDELWVASTEPSLSLQPTLGRGLAWIDPRLVVGPAFAVKTPAGLREALAWRWTADEAEGRVDRDRIEAPPSGAINLTATVDRARLRIEGTVEVQDSGEPRAFLPLGSSEPDEWRAIDEATGLDLPRRPMGPRLRRESGFGASGAAWEVVMPHPARGPARVRVRMERPWNGEGPIPVLALPEPFTARGTLLVAVDRSVRSTAEPLGLLVLDPAIAAQTIGGEGTGPVSGTSRLAHAFGYHGPGGRLRLRTENLAPEPHGGVIREAVMTTFASVEGTCRHHLVLRVASDRAPSLELTLPPEARLGPVRRDGQLVTPTRSGAALSIALPGSRPARSPCTISLDFAIARGTMSGEATLRPESIPMSLPCLSFCWQVVTKAPWTVAGHGPGLVAADPEPKRSWPRAFLDTWRTTWNPFADPGRATKAEAAMLRALEERVVATRPEEVALGEWFTRWDSGDAPLVMDRMALAYAGWGPKSRVVPPRGQASRALPTLEALHPLGLTVVPVGGALLITSRAEAPDRPGGPLRDPARRAAWELVLRIACAEGSDPSDRFQSVARWRGAATPKVSVPRESTEYEPPAENETIWRFTAPGWPRVSNSVRLVDQRERAARGWTVGLAVFLGGLAGRSASRRRRGVGLAVLFGPALLALAVFPVRLETIVSGVLAGSLAVFVLWLGQALPKLGNRRTFAPIAGSTTRRRRGSIGTALVLVAVAVSASWAFAQDRSGTGPILAIFPYEGSPRPFPTPDRVLLRLEDYERLKEQADTAAAPATPGPRALGVVHRVSWQGPGEVMVESEFDLLAGEGESAWNFPVEKTRAIGAALDGATVPVLVQPGGKMAAVAIAGPGRKRLVLRRTAVPREDPEGAALSMPVNAVASARFAIDARAEEGASAIEVPSARGTGTTAASRVEGGLGPADRLDVRWLSRKQSGTGPAVASGTVEGLLLWDAEPAGDRLRARLTCRKPGGTSVLRLGLEPGLVLRSVAIPGLIDSGRQGTAEAPEWVAHVDPPLPSGGTVVLEFWRGLPEGPGHSEDEARRTVPRVEPLGVERYTGALGFRKPADWSGRIGNGAGAGGEPFSEEVFVKLWGTLPDEPLTLSGAVRFARLPELLARTGPAARRLSVAPDLRLTIGAGRLELDLKADLVELEGRTYEAVLEFPASLRVIAVEAEGLTDWSRPEPGRVRLRFDGVAARQRSVRLRGWLPVPLDPLAAGGNRVEMKVPWPRWGEAENAPGTLTVTGPSKPALTPAPDVTLISSTAPGTAGGTFSESYRVDRPEAPGALRWEAEPPWTDVRVQSQVTLHPNSAEWVAVVQYDVTQGAIDAIHLKLPAVWAETAKVAPAGGGHQLTAESYGATTYWTIRPQRPIWGAQRLVLRAAVPLPKSGELGFPDIVPLGRGSSDRYLRLINAAGQVPVIEGLPGLQQVDDPGRFAAAEFAGPVGVPIHMYHVLREGWSLKIGRSADARGPGAGNAEREEDFARVGLADLTCSVASDGSALGLARYEVEPRSGSFLPVALPDPSEVLWASVNQTAVEPFRSAKGRWLIALDGIEASQVSLIWRSPAPAPSREGRFPIALPAPVQGRVLTRIAVHAPESVALAPQAGANVEPVHRDRLDLLQADWLQKRLADRLARFDRTSLRDREGLVSHLVRFGLLLRSAERAAAGQSVGNPVVREHRREWVRERARGLRRAMSEAIETAALDEFEHSAQVHLGLATADPRQVTLEIPEPVSTVRISPLGIAHAFQGESGAGERTLAIDATPIRPVPPSGQAETWVPILAALGLPLLILASIRAERSAPIVMLILTATLAALGLGGGPIPLGLGLGLAAVGWFSRPGARNPALSRPFVNDSL